MRAATRSTFPAIRSAGRRGVASAFRPLARRGIRSSPVPPRPDRINRIAGTATRSRTAQVAARGPCDQPRGGSDAAPAKRQTRGTEQVTLGARWSPADPLHHSLRPDLRRRIPRDGVRHLPRRRSARAWSPVAHTPRPTCPRAAPNAPRALQRALPQPRGSHPPARRASSPPQRVLEPCCVAHRVHRPRLPRRCGPHLRRLDLWLGAPSSSAAALHPLAMRARKDVPSLLDRPDRSHFNPT